MDMMREMLAAAAVVLLLAGLVWWLRRHGFAVRARGPARLLRVVERAPLAPQHSLHLVRVAGRGLLVGVSPGGCTLLESFEWERVEPAASVREVPAP